jgi:hypothetical protein
VVRMFVRHRVTEYPTWRAAYDEFDQERRGLGVTGDGVYQAVGDPNDVTVWHDFPSPEAAEAFVSSPRLAEVMQQAGVQGQPEIWITAEP